VWLEHLLFRDILRAISREINKREVQRQRMSSNACSTY
jgi:hypothetical protein